ncbi:MAG: LysR family transcriptional regulator [Clostridia bacterium]|nr:LysR family transcriptional regulator [Clostridia bacterium]
MELLQLKYFCDAAMTENFSQTAKSFMLPPSAISQSVRRLEEELGVKLFVRRANRVTLSAEGAIFYKGAKGALDALSAARSALRDRDGEITGEVHLFIGCNRRTVLSAIERYRHLYPGVTFMLDHGTQTNPESYDLIISDRVIAETGMLRRHLVRERLCIAVNESLAPTNSGELSLSDFKDCGFISMHRGSSLYLCTVEACQRHGFEPNIVIESDDPVYVRRYLELGMGVSLVPTFSWRGLFSDGIRLIDVGDIFRDTYIYSRRQEYVPKCVKLFEDMLAQAFAEEVGDKIDIG